MPFSISALPWFEGGLGLTLFLLPPLLTLVPRGAAPLAGVAGLCAAVVAIGREPAWDRPVRWFSLVLGALVIWGGVSAAWSIVPERSLVLDMRLLGLFASGLALTLAVPRLAEPLRLARLIGVGTALGIALAGYDLLTRGGLSQYVSIRPFEGPRLNQIAVWVALMTLPAAAMLSLRRHRGAAAAVAVIMAGTVYLLEGTTAKLALGVSLPVAAALFLWRRPLARAAGVMSLVAVLGAPLVLPRLAASPGIFDRINSFKESAGHRLLIWSFAGQRIAEKPMVGWGLDSSRAIPGGSEEARPGEKWLPLHPHDAALQVWLELGAPGAVLLALTIAGLWWRLAGMRAPRLFAAAAGGTLAAALTVGFAGWGVWQEWWLGTLAMALFAVLLMARVLRDAVRGRSSEAKNKFNPL